MIVNKGTQFLDLEHLYRKFFLDAFFGLWFNDSFKDEKYIDSIVVFLTAYNQCIPAEMVQLYIYIASFYNIVYKLNILMGMTGELFLMISRVLELHRSS